MRRIVLFIATNLAIMVTLSVVFSLLGIGGYIQPDGGLNYTALMIFALVWGMGGAFISLQISRWMAKRAMGVQLIDGRSGREELDWVYRTVEQLAQKARLPMPEVGVYDSPEVNAFATGPSQRRSLVAVSTGLLRGMRRDEVEGVLAHEVAHIQNGDMVTLTLIQGVVNAFVIFFARVIANVVRNMVDSRNAAMVGFAVTIVLDILLGILGAMIVAWFSRAREFRADAGAAQLSSRENMIGALKRLMQTHQLVDDRNQALATMKIAGGRKNWMAFFSTHPPLEARIAALEARGQSR
jgi:heat shock protein HtpX